MPMPERSDLSVTFETSCPSMETVPEVGSMKRDSIRISVDLPHPVCPTSATEEPAGTSSVTPSSTGPPSG
jgi:hypothetical protein